MTSGHFIYIPVMILIGIVIGFFIGQRATRDAIALEQAKKEKRAAARAAREGKKPESSNPV